MTTPESPMVARRRVRLALRAARDAAGLTQSDVAEHMEWSLSKVIRIESGEVSISQNDLRPLLTLLKINDRAVVEQLVASTRASRTRGAKVWWRESPYRENLSDASRRLIDFETDAAVSFMYQHMMVPGRLQTPEYAEALLSSWSDDLTPEQIRYRLEARALRRQAFLDDPRQEHIYIIFDESVFSRTLGHPSILANQLRELIGLIERNRITVRMLPFTFDQGLPTFGIFELIYLTKDPKDDDAAIYMEDFLQDTFYEDEATIAKHRAKFDRLWKAADDEEHTKAFVGRMIDRLAH